ncbi:hypothetical protein [uncultured Tateyamaria sp.]|uniref:hypothetical protein n=1 Tax=uncultured Tateyamaria sp. TaxID=455651 RepID=UPI002603BA9E|nr:hypothetical protein [uncultured Tateyamaria sp.]
MTEKPWLILTLRRTGGTSLTSFLAEVSQFPTIEHEPFNTDRIFGHITRDFLETGDMIAMQGAVKQAVARNPNIKHCVEIIPLEMTRALIDTCQAQGYGFMVLTRRDEARRMLSLLLAISTGAWGPEMAADIYPEIIAGTRQATPIDLQMVRNRVRQDYFTIGRTLSLLRNRQIDYQWLLFEELYLGETPIETQAPAIAAKLGIEIAADDPRLMAFSERDGQKSGSIAHHVDGYDAAVALLEELCTA